MGAPQRRLKEARTRKGMRSLTVALPENLHRALALARVEDGIAMNEAIREAVRAWIAQRKGAGKRRKKRAER